MPAWVHACDLLVVVLVTSAMAVAITGGVRERLADGLMLSLRSPWRPLLLAAAIAVVRHGLVRRPALHERLADGFTRVWRVVAHVGWPALHVAAVALFLTAVAQDYRPETGLTSFIMFGDEFDAQALPAVRALPHVVYPDSWGYDGQFYAQLALDPSLRDPALLRALDAPSYRARRMLFSWSAYAAGLGRPAWVLQAYAWQNVVAWLVLALLLFCWCPPGNLRHFAAWFACLFTNGMLASVHQALTDGPSMVLIAVSVLATERGRSGLAAGIVALAGLGRETNILGGAALAPPADARATSLARYAVRGLLIVLPLVAWTAYVRFTLGSADAGIATLDVPLRSFLQKWFLTVRELARDGWWSHARFNLAMLMSLTMQAGFVLWRWRAWRSSPWWRVGAAYAVLMAVAGSSVWEGPPVAITRVVLPLTVAFNMLIVPERRFWPLLVLGNLNVFEDVWTL